MRIAQLNLPVNLNNGAPADAAHAYIAGSLAGIFGGFTSWDGQGAWNDNSGKLYAEPVRVYQVAYAADPDLRAADTLRMLARDFKRQADQIAVFIIIDGESEFI